MKNLKLLNRKITNINDKILYASPSNDYNEGLVFITNNSIIFSNGNEIQNVISNDFKDFFKIQNGLSLYCATKNNITSFDNYNGMQLEVLELSDEIIDISLSPDLSILIILTSDLQFTIVSNDLQILTSFNLEQAGFGTAEQLSIGWGKKETQFHGKIGKDARNIVEHVEKYSVFDSKSTFMAWKDDGEYFVVSWISYSKIQNKSEAHTRMIRIFSKDGELFSTFEPTNVLENGLFWRTKSNLIATSCRNSKGLEIVFFEQNGLRHGGFGLYEAEFSENMIVSSISFNSSDDICAVVIQDVKNNVTSVKLFTTNNYSWYLKKIINLEGLEYLSIHWLLDKLHLCSENGVHYIYQWYFEIDRSIVEEYKSESNLSKLPNLISVIDGDKILMTPFEYCVIPPPYCAFTMNFTDNVSFVSLPIIDEMTVDYLSCFVQLSDNVCNWLCLTRKPVTESKDKIIETQLKFGRSNCSYTPIITAVLRLNDPINSICWINNHSFYCVVNNNIYLYQLENSQISINKLPIEDIIVGKVCYKTHLYIQDITGQVYQYENDNIKPLFKYSSFCSEMFAVKLKSESNDTVIALSTRFNQLYINSSLQPGTYLSILPLSSHHLICTSINQKLRCLNLIENNLNDLINLLDEKNYKCEFDFDETIRLIEPGTEIITCVPSDSKIILMMPRGNLETVYPRALVLDDLKKLMDKCLYSEAIEKMRRQRVNLNLLYDHNPKMFMANLEKLVRCNSKNDRLVLLISELSSEDVTETMYKRFYYQSTKEKTKQQGKVNNVCSAVAKILENDINDDYINLILTCYVKMTPTASDKALQLLRQFKDNGKQKIWDKGLKYLQYLISIDDLYRVALSTYDLNLTLQVAQKTQLDPKEYVSFINGLNELPCENYRRFKINIFLKRPSTALEYIVNVADLFWDETVELVIANNLYVKALELFTRGSNHYNIISSLFAEHLISKSNDLKSAGMVYLRTNDKVLCKMAGNCFIKTLHWKEWIIASKKSEMSEDEIKINLENISGRLKDVGRFNEALLINEVYLKDLNNAFNICLDGRLFTDAFRIMVSISGSSEEDFSTRIHDSINNSYESFVSQLEENERKYVENFERLVEVRLNFIKTYKDLKFAGEDETLPDYMSDTISEVTSNSSRSSSMNSKMSNSSQNSSKFKLKKKKVKNPWSDKKGSQKEEVGIIENLYRNIKHTQTMMSDIDSLIEMLCFIGSIDHSRSLIKACNKLLRVHSESINIIWDEFLVDRNYNSNEYEVQISNHIKVNRSDQYAGRRRYLLDEEFLKCSPQMNISMITNIIGGL